MDFDLNHRHLAGSEMAFLIGTVMGAVIGFSYMMITYPWTNLIVLSVFAVYAVYGGFKFALRIFLWIKKDWNEK